jgi:hypothetical protein
MGRRGGEVAECGGLSSFLRRTARALRLKFERSREFNSELRGNVCFDVGGCEGLCGCVNCFSAVGGGY